MIGLYRFCLPPVGLESVVNESCIDLSNPILPTSSGKLNVDQTSISVDSQTDSLKEIEGTSLEMPLLDHKKVLEEEASIRLLKVLSNKETRLSTTTLHGCGLSFLATKIKGHYSNEAKRLNRLPTRLIGSQAVSLARYGYRLVDCLSTENESSLEKIRRLALSKAVEFLRNAGGLFNKISVGSVGEIDQLVESCKLYYNILALFYPTCLNVTVWTVGYAIPHHASELYHKYKVGYGILSLQAKESKHAAIKNDLSLSNRSNKSSAGGKWWQVRRSNYIRSFYLPEHQPALHPIFHILCHVRHGTVILLNSVPVVEPGMIRMKSAQFVMQQKL